MPTPTYVDTRSAVLSIKVGSATAVSYVGIISYDLQTQNKSQITFDMIQGGTYKTATLAITALVDTASGGLYKAAYDAAVNNSNLTITWQPMGATGITYTIANAYVDGKPGFSDGADPTVSQKSTATITFNGDDFTMA